MLGLLSVSSDFAFFINFEWFKIGWRLYKILNLLLVPIIYLEIRLAYFSINITQQIPQWDTDRLWRFVWVLWQLTSNKIFTLSIVDRIFFKDSIIIIMWERWIKSISWQDNNTVCVELSDKVILYDYRIRIKVLDGKWSHVYVINSRAEIDLRTVKLINWLIDWLIKLLMTTAKLISTLIFHCQGRRRQDFVFNWIYSNFSKSLVILSKISEFYLKSFKKESFLERILYFSTMRSVK